MGAEGVEPQALACQGPSVYPPVAARQPPRACRNSSPTCFGHLRPAFPSETPFSDARLMPPSRGPGARPYITKKRLDFSSLFQWEQRESNPRPSACKADALNQLSYAPKHPVSKQDCKYMEIFPNQQDFRRKFTENSQIRRKSQSSALQRKGGCWQDGSLRSGKSRASPNPCQGQCNRWNNSRGHPSRTICLRLP